MSDRYGPAPGQRFLEDMRIKGLQPKTLYLRRMRDVSWFPGHAPDSSRPADLRAFQLDMKARGVGAPTFYSRLTGLRFFFATTCPHPEMKRHMCDQRAAGKIPVVLSAKEVARLLEAAPGPWPKQSGGLQGCLRWRVAGQRSHPSEGWRYRARGASPTHLPEARPAGRLFPGRNRVDPISTRQLNRAFGVA